MRRSEPQFSWAIGPLNSAGRLAHATSGCPIQSRFFAIEWEAMRPAIPKLVFVYPRPAEVA